MNNFLEMQFPTDISYGAIGGPEFFTDIITTNNGIEMRNINWQSPRLRFNLSPAIKTKVQLDEIIAFFRICHGKALGFRFKDWSDFKLEKQQIAIGNNIDKKFQLIKTYSVGEMNSIRKITKPIKDTVKIYLNDKKTKANIDYSTGVLIFETAPKNGEKIIVEGEFDVPVRFDIDKLSTSIESYCIYSHNEILLSEIKL